MLYEIPYKIDKIGIHLTRYYNNIYYLNYNHMISVMTVEYGQYNASSGVPQGSHISSLLFYLFINNIKFNKR